MIAGDWNVTPTHTKDRSTHSDKTYSRSRDITYQFAKELDLRDIWRDRNPDVAMYLCYSSAHKPYSHIDLFMVSASIASRVKGCVNDSILISDHAPNSLVHVDPGWMQDPRKWLDQRWLQNTELLTILDGQIDLFFH